MAPPPSPSNPLFQRLVALTTTLQFVWFVGHLTLLFCALRYGLSYLAFNYYSRWARFCYRTAFLAAAVTYGIVVNKSYRARLRQGRSWSLLELLADENVEYLFMASTWLFSRQIPLAMVPFAIYSIFHVLTYARANLLPTLFPAPPSASPAPASPTGASRTPKSSLAVSETIGRFVKDHYDASMTLVAALEMLLWVRIFCSALLFQKGSWVLLLLYSAFLRARFSHSGFVQGAFARLRVRGDDVMSRQGLPPQVRGAWEGAKGMLATFVGMTEFGGVLASRRGPVKKAQ